MNKAQVKAIYHQFIREHNLKPDEATLCPQGCLVMYEALGEVKDLSITLHEVDYQVVVNNKRLPEFDDGLAEVSPVLDIETHHVPRFRLSREGVGLRTPESVISLLHHDKDFNAVKAAKIYLRQRIMGNEMLKCVDREMHIAEYGGTYIRPCPEFGDLWVEFGEVRAWWSSLLPHEQRDLWDYVRTM